MTGKEKKKQKPEEDYYIHPISFGNQAKNIEDRLRKQLHALIFDWPSWCYQNWEQQTVCFPFDLLCFCSIG